jgi:hypothetical protein
MALMPFFCLPALAQQPPCVIGGTVVDSASNRPVARARVMASGSYSLVRLTGEQGDFCFEKLDVGEYRVLVQKPGYEETEHGVVLAVEETGVINPLAIRMTPYAIIAGMVLDDSGEPLSGAEVTVWNRVRGKTGWGPEEVESRNSDNHGAFRFSELAPGTYYLSVNQAENDEHGSAFPMVGSDGQPLLEKPVETFYAGAFSFGGATPLELKAGQHADSLVLTLKKTRLRRVSGRIAYPPRSAFLTYEGESETGRGAEGAIPIARDGTFVKLGLPPAHYTLRLNDGPQAIAQKEVDLTIGDAQGVTLEPIVTVDIPVVFHTEGKGPAFLPRAPGGAPSVLVREDSGEPIVLQTVGDRAYRFAAVPLGVYRLELAMAGQSLYLKGVSYGGETQTGNKVDLRSARTGGLELTFSAKVASVQGRAVPPSGEAGENQSTDLTVILVGADVSIALETGTDQKGRFQMRTVPPGKYRLFAIEGFDDGVWGSPELAKALAAKSVEVELKESEKKQVSVTIISAGEWNAALKKIGE